MVGTASFTNTSTNYTWNIMAEQIDCTLGLERQGLQQTPELLKSSHNIFIILNVGSTSRLFAVLYLHIWHFGVVQLQRQDEPLSHPLGLRHLHQEAARILRPRPQHHDRRRW